MSVNEARKAAGLEARARQLGIPAWQLEMMEAVDDATIRDIVADSRRGWGSPPPTSHAQPRAAVSSSERSPTATAISEAIGSLKPPPGVELCDRLVDVQDAMDRREKQIAEEQIDAIDDGLEYCQEQEER